MKLAILLFGEYREFKYSIPSFSIFDEFKPDYYVSTWDISNDGFYKEEVTKEKIKKFLPNSDITLGEILIKPNGDEEEDNEKKIHYHWRTLVKRIEELGNQYDGVILSRIDLLLRKFNKSEFLKLNKENIIYIEGGDGGSGGISDNFMYGSQSSIFKFINEIPHETMPSHIGIYKSMKKSGINISESDSFISVNIIRSNMRNIVLNDNFFESSRYSDIYYDFVLKREDMDSKLVK